MPLTYETYKTEPMSLTMEEMASLHSELYMSDASATIRLPTCITTCYSPL